MVLGAGNGQHKEGRVWRDGVKVREERGKALIDGGTALWFSLLIHHLQQSTVFKKSFS